MVGIAATDALEAAIVDHLQGTHAADFDYIDTGIGTTDPVVTDTDLENDTGTPARVQGTMSQPSANIHRVVGTVTYSSSLAITEVGLFNALTSGTMAMREVFAAFNVVSGNSIQFTLDVTLASQVT